MKLFRIFFIVIILALALAACSSDSTANSEAKVLTVKSGESIQKVINKANAGDLILVEAGTYEGSIVIQTKDITLRGLDRNAVVIDGKYSVDNGIVVAADGVRVENLTVQKFRTNGVLVYGGYSDQNAPEDSSKAHIVKRYSVQYVNANGNGQYGIYAFASRNGVIANTFTYANADAGIYVGQCKPCNADINDNYATFNGLGFQGANASDELYIYQNDFSNNQSGIHLLSETKEQKAPQEKVTVAANLVVDNNNEDAPTTTPDIFGYGIVVAGGSGNQVLNNSVIDQTVGGIILTSQGEFLPQNNKVAGNTVSKVNDKNVGNGAIDLQYFIPGRPDVMSSGNCFESNTFGSANIERIEMVLPCIDAAPGPFAASFRPKGKTKTPPLYSDVTLPELKEAQIPGNLKEIPKKIVKILPPDLSLVQVPSAR